DHAREHEEPRRVDDLIRGVTALPDGGDAAVDDVDVRPAAPPRRDALAAFDAELVTQGRDRRLRPPRQERLWSRCRLESLTRAVPKGALSWGGAQAERRGCG